MAAVLMGAGLVGIVELAPAGAATPAAVVPDQGLRAVGSPIWQTNNSVLALDTAGGVLYAGGAFTSTRPPGNALGSEADGLICLDADGWITGANQIARQMVPNLASADQPGVHVSSVFGVAYELLFDAVRRPDAALEIPLWTGLRLQALPLAGALEAGSVDAGQGRRSMEGVPLKEIEVTLIRKAVEQARGNVAQAARALGISRATNGVTPSSSSATGLSGT
jgi:hypothetical protein